MSFQQLVSMGDQNLTVYVGSGTTFVVISSVSTTRSLELSHLFTPHFGGYTIEQVRAMQGGGYPDVHVRFQGATNQVNVIGSAYSIGEVTPAVRNLHAVWSGSMWLLVSSS